MFSLNCKGKLMVTDNPLVMGIINITPDSFYAGSRHQNGASVLEQASRMLAEGADIIDVGGQSTRPGSKRISVEEEMQRVIPAIEIMVKHFPGVIISVDTFHSSVARQSIASGAAIINDISAGDLDPDMIEAVATLQVPYICMHMKGIPENMQVSPHYENITKEILDFFIFKTEECTRAGITDVIIDPGFGFGKTISQNFLLLKEMATFKMLGKPILAGLSRKSTIYRSLGVTAEEALNGSTVLHTLALQNGADILRVHDVKEAREAVILHRLYQEA